MTAPMLSTLGIWIVARKPGRPPVRCHGQKRHRTFFVFHERWPMRPLVFQCPNTSIPVIFNLKAHQRAQLLARNSPFAFMCSCCGDMHLWRLRDSSHVRRLLADFS